MRPKDRALAEHLAEKLEEFSREVRPLRGIAHAAERECFLEQVMESCHRVLYPGAISAREISPRRADPSNDLFDPVKASILHWRNGDEDEAFWLIFLFVHFGKNAKGGWRYLKEVYGGGDAGAWTWGRVSRDVAGFRDDLAARASRIRRPGVPGGFGNHRKYESLDARSTAGTGSVVESYVAWVAPPRTHRELFIESGVRAGGDRRAAFDLLYQSMRVVRRFGRTARFDYLAMLGKLRFADIEPGSTYMKESTGPAGGARLLFEGSKDAPESASSLESSVTALEKKLGVGMQVIEDALCNWQKSPSRFKRFRG